MESVFQLIFHYITKHQKIIHFSGIHFPKKTIFQLINGIYIHYLIRGLVMNMKEAWKMAF